MKLPSLLAACVVGGIFAIVVCAVKAEEPTASPAPSVSDTAADATTEDATSEDATKEVESPSPDGKFAFVMDRGEDEKTIDLVDKKTEKVLQHIDESEIGSESYGFFGHRIRSGSRS